MTAGNNKTSDKEQIRQLKTELTNALRNKDVDGVAMQFAAEIVMFILAPPLQYKTGDNTSGGAGIEEWVDSFQGAIGYELRELEITTGETVAFCHSLNRVSGTRTGGKQTDIRIRETLGLRKIEGRWKITHEHQSVPFYMDGGGKAAIDLKP